MINLGIIGISEGNGHPFSWSAIINGYNIKYFSRCPFPVINNYLKDKVYPDDFLTHKASVTHIWTQDSKISTDISLYSKIPNIVDDYREMIGKVDAVLLARDDSENHLKFAKPFLEAGLPIYIDKPLATKLANAKKIFDLEKYHTQIFTCSALRYADEFQLSTQKLAKQMGDIKKVEAYTPKSWGKYAVHIIEPVLNYLNYDVIISKSYSVKSNGISSLVVKLKNGMILNFNSLGNINHPIEIKFIGIKCTKSFIFKDSFSAFKKAINTFLNQIRYKKQYIPKNQVLRTIKLIELGL